MHLYNSCLYKYLETSQIKEKTNQKNELEMLPTQGVAKKAKKL